MNHTINKNSKKYWDALDIIYPKHNTDGICCDNLPNGHGNFGCKRCQAIIDLEVKRRIRIWPRWLVKEEKLNRKLKYDY